MEGDIKTTPQTQEGDIKTGRVHHLNQSFRFDDYRSSHSGLHTIRGASLTRELIRTPGSSHSLGLAEPAFAARGV